MWSSSTSGPSPASTGFALSPTSGRGRDAYADDGLVVVGVHTPEFSFEHDIGLVQQAVHDRDIHYPVATDDDFAVWSSFDNHYWPALYFLDREGHVRDSHFGEGGYAARSGTIQKLLGVTGPGSTVRSPRCVGSASRPRRRLAPPALTRDVPRVRTGRRTVVSGRRGVRPDPRPTSCPNKLRGNHWALVRQLDGRVLRSVVLDEAGGSIACRFHARDAHLVMTPARHTSPSRSA